MNNLQAKKESRNQSQSNLSNEALRQWVELCLAQIEYENKRDQEERKNSNE